MSDPARTKKFEDEMKAILQGEAEAPNETLQHFADRFNAGRAEQEKVAAKLQELDSAISLAKTEYAKITGFVEGLAVDLRHLWEKANSAPASAPKAQPEIVEAPKA